LSRSTDHDALWKIVHDQCVPGQTSHHDPAPCASLDLTDRWAVLKVLVGRMGSSGNNGSGEALQDHGCAVAAAR